MMKMRKILLIGDSPISDSPYIRSYIEVFEQNEISYELLFWNRYLDGTDQLPEDYIHAIGLQIINILIGRGCGVIADNISMIFCNGLHGAVNAPNDIKTKIDHFATEYKDMLGTMRKANKLKYIL